MASVPSGSSYYFCPSHLCLIILVSIRYWSIEKGSKSGALLLIALRGVGQGN